MGQGRGERETGDPFAGEGAAARAALVREIVADGGLRDPAWRAAFAEVPRHLFVPCYFAVRSGVHERMWREDPDPVRRADWLHGAYRDGPLATRLRDGDLVSSSSQPSLMALMLDALDLRTGDTVLEIGAGTGYNAALLAHRLGDEAVTTIDLDPEITESARRHLDAAGYHPAVVTGDGARGCPDRAPYDAVVATCTLASVPHAWVEQCAPGARILAPLSTGLISLRVGEGAEGPEAEGHFLRTSAYFVPLRGGSGPGEAAAGVAGLPRRAVQNDLFRFLLTLTDGALDPHEAVALWEREHRPDRSRFGVTVRGGRQWAWLDDPQGPYVWPLDERRPLG
ncbi:methyltransferase domain-containing protein [Streptomyces sp. NPDC005805]|uniref:methyltransferase domain-containing protein n=1 Tax=Streptomyces sp. NPDC005805 TaxID=3157068 RepID=UPI003408C721